MKTDESDDWKPRRFKPGELEGLIEARLANEPRQSACCAQVAICSREYACFTAQNVFLERGEAALPVSPKCNARCIGCISEQEAEAGIPSPQTRIAEEAAAEELARRSNSSFGTRRRRNRLVRPRVRRRAAAAIDRHRAGDRTHSRASATNGTINLNTNGSQPAALARCIDAGLQAVRISLNSFRPNVYAAYYRPQGYGLGDVFASVRLARERGLAVSLNLLTHPGVTDEEAEVAAADAFLRATPVAMVQTRTLNIDPVLYFETVGRPRAPLGMRRAIEAIRAVTRVGNFTHTH